MTHTNKNPDSLFTFEYEFCPDGRWRITRNVLAQTANLFDDRAERIPPRGQEWLGEDRRWSHNPGNGWETNDDAYYFWLSGRNPDARYTVERFWHRDPLGEPLTDLTWQQASAKVGGQVAIGWDHEQNLEVGESTWRINSANVSKITRTA